MPQGRGGLLDLLTTHAWYITSMFIVLSISSFHQLQCLFVDVLCIWLLVFKKTSGLLELLWGKYSQTTVRILKVLGILTKKLVINDLQKS